MTHFSQENRHLTAYNTYTYLLIYSKPNFSFIHSQHFRLYVLSLIRAGVQGGAPQNSLKILHTYTCITSQCIYRASINPLPLLPVPYRTNYPMPEGHKSL